MSNNESGSIVRAPSLFEFLSNNPDQVLVGKLPESERTTPETGVDRLRKMFSLDQYGYQSKEVIMITQSFYATALGGGMIGAIVQSRNAFVNFLENNQATKFQNHLEAKRELQRIMYLAFGKGAWRWGWRIGLFSLSFTTFMTTISVYRGKESLVEYLVAGGVTGALVKMNLGLKGACTGCLLGTVLGGIAGGTSLLVLKLGGTSMDEIRNFSKMLKEHRDTAIRNKAKEQMINEHAEFTIKANLDDALLKDLKVDEE